VVKDPSSRDKSPVFKMEYYYTAPKEREGFTAINSEKEEAAV
jgi:hypothetical protein